MLFNRSIICLFIPLIRTHSIWKSSFGDFSLSGLRLNLNVIYLHHAEQ